MKHKFFSLLLSVAAIVAIFILPLTVMAGGVASEETKPSVSAEKSIEGTLTAMERYGHILIRPETGNLTKLRMRPEAVVTRNGKPAKLSDLHVGDSVRANYDSKNWVFELNANGS